MLNEKLQQPCMLAIFKVSLNFISLTPKDSENST